MLLSPVQHPRGVIIAAAIGLTALVVPIWLSVRLAWKQSLADEQARVLTYASDGLARTDRLASKIDEAIQRLKNANLPPCSKAELDLMRRIDLDSNYIAAVGRVSGDTMLCDSLGTPPIALGPVSGYTENGHGQRLGVQLAFATQQPQPAVLDMFSKFGFAIVVDRSNALDSPKDPNGLLDLFRPSQPNPFSPATHQDKLHPGWYRSVAKGSTLTFVDSGYVIALARSRQYDVGIIAVSPLADVQQQVMHSALMFVPIGLICGVALAWTIFYLSRRTLALSSILRGAARRREFRVEYQPIVDLVSGRWVGAEALLRWQRDNRNVRPDLFVPAAEESGVITLITECVMEIVAQDLPALMALNPDFRVAINLSVADLKSARTTAQIAVLLQSSGAQARNLEVEATERGLMQDDDIRDAISGIRTMHVSASIDDFGTGYSSLSRLQMLDLDTLKIDKSFVDTIGTDGATSQVVLHIIKLAQSLSLEMVAEGVEHEYQMEFLRQKGVQRAQGWYFAKAMPIQSLCQALSRQSQNEVV